jgi:pyruvate dehydrogenase (quinone)
MGGAPKFEESQTLPEVSYAGFARSIGLEGVAVEKPEQIGPAWDRALAATVPVVLDVRCDPDIPPIPPHTTFEELKDTAAAVIKGDPDARGIVTKGLKTKAQEFLPGRGDEG